MSMHWSRKSEAGQRGSLALALQTQSQDTEAVELGIAGNSMDKWFCRDRQLVLRVKTGLSRHLSKVESGFDRISGSRLEAAMDLCWYGTVQSYGGNL